VTSLDVLVVISHIQQDGAGPLGALASAEGPFVDTYKDGVLSPMDVLAVVGAINDEIASAGEGEHANVAADVTAVAPVVEPAEPLGQLTTIEFVSLRSGGSLEAASDSPSTHSVDSYFTADYQRDRVSARDATTMDDHGVTSMFQRTMDEDDSIDALVAALDLDSALADIAADVSQIRRDD
jgi:hypothetical protein